MFDLSALLKGAALAGPMVLLDEYVDQLPGIIKPGGKYFAVELPENDLIDINAIFSKIWVGLDVKFPPDACPLSTERVRLAGKIYRSEQVKDFVDEVYLMVQRDYDKCFIVGSVIDFDYTKFAEDGRVQRPAFEFVMASIAVKDNKVAHMHCFH